MRSMEASLARRGEGASHMAEGYTRAAAGNIEGFCTALRPGETDMITRSIHAADSIDFIHAGGRHERVCWKISGGRY